MNEVRLLGELLDVKTGRDEDMVNHVSYLESHFIRLQVIGISMEESVKVILLMYFLPKLNEFQPVPTSADSLLVDAITSFHFTALEIKKKNSIGKRQKMKPEHVEDDIGTVVLPKRSPERRFNSIQPTTAAKSIRCCNCEKLGHMRHNLKSKQRSKWVEENSKNSDRYGQDLRVALCTLNSVEKIQHKDKNSISETVVIDSCATEHTVNILSRFRALERTENSP